MIIPDDVLRTALPVVLPAMLPVMCSAPVVLLVVASPVPACTEFRRLSESSA